MHIDEQKKFDVRNIERNIRAGLITQKEYEAYLSKLPDVSDKAFSPEEAEMPQTEDLESTRPAEAFSKKKETKKKVRGKGK